MGVNAEHKIFNDSFKRVNARELFDDERYEKLTPE